MKYWILILLPIFLFIRTPDIRAHDVVTVDGKTQRHQHVYRRQQYGKPLQQGHVVNSAGGNGTILWGSDMRPEYGKSQVRRSGPVINDKYPRPDARYKSNIKYGSTVSGYGKSVSGYGKPVQAYGKPYKK